MDIYQEPWVLAPTLSRNVGAEAPTAPILAGSQPSVYHIALEKVSEQNNSKSVLVRHKALWLTVDFIVGGCQKWRLVRLRMLVIMIFLVGMVL